MSLNRLSNASNPYQGKYKKVLCVCSAGLLRSPTAAVVLSQPPYNYNTRAAGANKEYALVPLDPVLLSWADEIVCMEDEHEFLIKKMMDDGSRGFAVINKPIINLDIVDGYEYRNEDLVGLIKEKYDAITKRRDKNSKS